MLKQRLQGFIAGLLVAILLISTLTLASGTLREVFYGVNVVVNGELQQFDDDMQPFISDGRTFLPVRGISEALGVPINWDNNTNTVYVGRPPIGEAPYDHPIIGEWRVLGSYFEGEFQYLDIDWLYLIFLPGGWGYAKDRGNIEYFQWSVRFGNLTMSFDEGKWDFLNYTIYENRFKFDTVSEFGYESTVIWERIEE
ncbi:MAG: copper amine oxidase N-terminal domain-containing protein [Oscillospiraceae bacterium]|nr:copper amine oxidase N-terminal domain-containing protein [Oscillospiraceae bacterium]